MNNSMNSLIHFPVSVRPLLVVSSRAPSRSRRRQAHLHLRIVPDSLQQELLLVDPHVQIPLANTEIR